MIAAEEPDRFALGATGGEKAADVPVIDDPLGPNRVVRAGQTNTGIVHDLDGDTGVQLSHKRQREERTVAAAAHAHQHNTARRGKSAHCDIETGGKIVQAAMEAIVNAITVSVHISVTGEQPAVTIRQIRGTDTGQRVECKGGVEHSQRGNTGRGFGSGRTQVKPAGAAALQENHQVFSAFIPRGHGVGLAGQAQRPIARHQIGD